MVGCLMYVVTCTRPDIVDEVGSVSKYCDNYTSEQYLAATHIPKYLLMTLDLVLVRMDIWQASI